jgi:hypothetical protein
MAPADAVICVPYLHTADRDDETEAEYLVDRRRLGKVNVVRRFQQKSMGTT